METLIALLVIGGVAYYFFQRSRKDKTGSTGNAGAVPPVEEETQRR